MKYLAFIACLFIGLGGAFVQSQVMYSVYRTRAIKAAQENSRPVETGDKPQIAIPTEYVVVPIERAPDGEGEIMCETVLH